LAEFSAIRGLQPEDPAIWIRETLAHEDREVMLVGHMPNLPRLLTLLVTGREAPLLEFPLHGLVAIEIARGAAGEHYEERWRLVL
jgi:phosphohistidine phosphatase SixA